MFSNPSKLLTAAAVTVTVTAATAAESQWTIDSETQVQQVLGVGAWTAGNDIAAASANGIGGFFERWNGNKWSKELLGDTEVGFLMDAATSDQVSVGSTMWPIIVSTDAGQTYSRVSSLNGLSQSASVFPPGVGDQIGLVGGFMATQGVLEYGVAHSSNLGESWTVSAIPDETVRYGAFPTTNTWYVSAGHWPYDSTSSSTTSNHAEPHSEQNMKQHRLSEKLTRDTQSNSFQYTFDAWNRTATAEDSGYAGNIWKTTDAGVTWNNVFTTTSTDAFYFNSISCATPERCVAVAEGDGAGSFRAYVTQDGGVTWTDQLPTADIPSNQVSMMGAGWLSETEGWVTGTAKDGRNLVGLFYRTTDGGKTYALEQELSNCFPFDMDMTKEGHMGLASCMSSSGSTCSIATLK